ncbi:TonB-dependent receptor domain-containing protein [Thiopseudomonas alkaliphila]|uniref:TonB-dependent receptor domain-containing protein n=1 Tax=Thiopseudomonas alkaliphila TaxID=1697053 RepID=UPI0025757BFD|nr:TonB-dependent receptor [Thiopseudomonas alkaliphila]MDM1708131.1 TonB-dependent receptor [Thiopseudomonas alkaliphila]
MHIPFSRSLLACSVFAVSSVALANETIDFGNVVVSASGFEQKITDAPASISVVSNEDLKKKRYNNLAQALDDVEGIDVKQGVGKTGGLNISMRGMPSEYTLILIDGRRQNSAGNVTPNGFNETSTSFMPPMSAIERIEVIRGPMSTLYGSDAMGGVINIITKKVNSEWSGSVTVDHTFQEERDFGDTSNTSFYASGPVVEDLLGLTVRGSFFDRQKSDLSYGNGVEVSKRGPSPVAGQNFNLGTKITFTPHDNHDFALDLEKGRQKYNNDECQLGTLDGLNSACTGPDANNKASGYSDELKFERTQYALTHTGRFSAGTLESAVTHKTTETIGRTNPGGTIGTPVNKNFLPGVISGNKRDLKSKELIVDTKFVAPITANNVTTIGGQYINAKMDDGLASKQFKQESAAIFAENEWYMRDDLALTLGGRYDRHQAFGGEFSPRAYLVWNTNDNWTMKGGISKGYKTPDINDLHSGINGATGQGKTITIGNPDLKPETTTSTEFGLYFDNLAGFNANATLFHNKFKDKITDGQPVRSPYCVNNKNKDDPSLNGTCGQLVNVDEAVTQGFELAGRWQFAPAWSISANYTFTDSEQKSGDNKGEPLTNTPKHLANASLNWTTTDKLNLWLKTEYRGKRARFLSKYSELNATEKNIYNTLSKNTKAYTLFHLGGSYQATDNLAFNATIYNLLDKDFTKGKSYKDGDGNIQYGTNYSHSGRSTTGTIEEGRRLWISATYDF